MIVSWRDVVGYFAIGLYAVLMTLPTRGFAQRRIDADVVILPADLGAKQVTLAAKTQDFAAIIASLSRQIGRGILVDDMPRRKQADVEFQGAAADALDKVGAAFDYAWEVNKRGLIVMHKQFNANGEHPQMNVAELRKMADDVVRIMKTVPFEPNPPFGSPPGPSPVSILFQALTSQQVQALRAGQTLHASALSPHQSQLLQQAIWSNAMGDAFAVWLHLKTQLDGWPTSFLQWREWPAFYQKRRHEPVTSSPDNPSRLQLAYVVQERNGSENATTITERALPASPPAPVEKGTR